MKTIPVFLLIIFTAFLLKADNKTKSFSVSKGGLLQIQMQIGDLRISVWDKNEVQITYEADDDDDDWGELPEIKQNGNTITYKSSGWGSSDVKFKIPANFNVDAKVQAGDIKMEGSLTGNLKAYTSGGDIRIEDVNGTVTIKTGGGDIKTGNIQNLDVESYGGNISTANINGEAKVSTAGGNIKMDDVKKSAVIKTAGGNIRIGSVGGNASVASSGGNLKIGNISGFAKINTAGGNISMESVTGRAEIATAAGNIRVALLEGESKIKTASGNIEITLSRDLSGGVTASSSFGDIKLYVPSGLSAVVTAEANTKGMWGSDEKSIIKSDFPVTNSSRDNKNIIKTYKINSGEKHISLKVQMGEIKIYKK